LALGNYITKQGIDYQLAPLHIHRHNKAERAIQTFKNYFITGLCSVDPSFPLKFWDKLLPQATITLNILRKSGIDPRMSAYAQLNGHYDFNRTPWRHLAPESLHMKNQTNRPLGTLMALMATTWAQHWITTDVTKSTSQK
jgi:hypothetical protein